MSSVRKKRNFKGLQLAESPLAAPGSRLFTPSGGNSGGASATGTGGAESAGPSAGGSVELPRTRATVGSSSTASGATTAVARDAGANPGAGRRLNGSSGGASTSTTASTNRGRSDATAAGASSASSTSAALGAPGLRSGDVDPVSGANYHNKLSEQLANLELGIEYKLDLKNEDLRFLSELGSGNGGTVTKVLHEKSNTIMAKKVVFIDAKPSVRKQILRELQILHECNSKYIVSFYGAYLNEPHICMCMEFMDKGSLDNIYKRWGPIAPEICGKIVVVVVHGLTYLYDAHRIIHRDVKPSNILVNSQGQIKICDFGVSGELINSIADTFVGTSTYMSPERIQGDQYSVKSDVWSLGVSVIELATGRFPFADNDSDESDDDGVPEELRGTLSPTRPQPSSDGGGGGGGLGVGGLGAGASERKRNKSGVSLEGSSAQMSILDLLQHIVNEPPPRLPAHDADAAKRFPKAMDDFVTACLIKDPALRPTPKDLTTHPYVVEQEQAKVDLAGWVAGLK